MAGFEGFETLRVEVQSEALGKSLTINVRRGGSGPPLLLIHGFPQSGYMWHKVAGKLAEKYTVVAPDLRGYGESDKPAGTESHVEYSKREMAADQVQVMDKLGFQSFYLIGHDRGARVSHRLALDHPNAVKRLMLLDIVPTIHHFENTDMRFAKTYYHWFFLIQPSPLPENVLLAGPEAAWNLLTGTAMNMRPEVFSDEAVAEYKRTMLTPEGIHAGCEDYRAAASSDMELDAADRAAGKKLKIPALRVLWGAKGLIPTYGDVEAVWKKYSDDDTFVSGRAVNSGHFIPEELSEEFLAEVEAFMRESTS